MPGKNIGIGIAIKIQTNTATRPYILRIHKNPPIGRRAKQTNQTYIEISQLTFSI
jgi:hypothetical protein